MFCISKLITNSTASKAGLRERDTILYVNDLAASDLSMDDLVMLINSSSRIKLIVSTPKRTRTTNNIKSPQSLVTMSKRPTPSHSINNSASSFDDAIVPRASLTSTLTTELKQVNPNKINQTNKIILTTSSSSRPTSTSSATANSDNAG